MALTTGTVTVADGTTIHYETRNRPSPTVPSLILLHHYGGSPSTWAAFLAAPALAHLHTVAYHARGWAPSTGPRDPTAYAIPTQAADLAAVLAATTAGAAGVVLVAHSMGAKVAQHYAATAAPAARPRALVLVAPAPLRGVVLPPEAARQQRAAYGSAAGVAAAVREVLTARPDALGEEALQACVRDALRGSAEARAAWPAHGMGADYGELVGRIQGPVLVLRGDRDFERELVGELGVAEGWVNRGIENCGHLVPLEQPELLAREVVAFLEETLQVSL